RQVIAEIELAEIEAEAREAERRDGVPQAEESDRRLHRLSRPVFQLGLVHAVRKIERRRRAAAEADDVDDGIGGERRLEVAVRFVDLAAFAGAEQSAGKVAEK